MSVSYIHTAPAREMLSVLAKEGPEMTSALLLYTDDAGNIYWHGSDNMKLTQALWMLEKVKMELLSRS